MQPICYVQNYQNVVECKPYKQDMCNEQVFIMKRNSIVQYLKFDIWKMLMIMNLEDEHLTLQYYDYLYNNHSQIRRICNIPLICILNVC